MIVDDEAEIRKALRRRLGIMGYEVEEAGTARAAVDRVRAGGISAVLMDLWLPDSSGFEAMDQIHKVAPELPVLVVSGHGTDATRHAAERAGAFGFLPKPLDTEILERELERAVARGERETPKTDTVARLGRILLADDDSGFRTALARLLRHQGYEVFETSSGREAVAAWQESAFDAALLDMHMENGDGISAARGIRLLDPEATILYLSGEASRREIVEGTPFASGGCLRKPIDTEEFPLVVTFLVESGRNSRDEARRRREKAARPWVEKTADALRKKGREIVASGELRRVGLLLVLTSALSVTILGAVNAAHLKALEAHDEIERVAPNLGEAYRRIEGFLERDERRELAQERR